MCIAVLLEQQTIWLTFLLLGEYQGILRSFFHSSRLFLLLKVDKLLSGEFNLIRFLYLMKLCCILQEARLGFI